MRRRLAHRKQALRAALVARLRRELAIEVTDDVRMTAVIDETIRLWRSVEALCAAVDAHDAAALVAADHMRRSELRLDAVEGRVDRLSDRHDVLVRRHDAAATRLHALVPTGAGADTTLARDVLALQAWLQHAPPADARVAVITPTRDRAGLLGGALASVRAQTHGDWQHVVVDDGSQDATPALLAGLDDPRVTVVRTEGRGNPAARNAGIDAVAADVDVVTYLDDDNVMLPHWLGALAWAFDRHPDVDVMYGARVIEDGSPWPYVHQEPFDRAKLQHMGIMDQNVLAHRPGLPGVRYDERLRHGADHDLELRLTDRHTPLALPVIAVLYRTAAAGRLSDEPGEPATLRRIRGRAFAAAPVR